MEEKLVVSPSASLGSVSMSLGDRVEPDIELLSPADEFSEKQVARCELASMLQDTMERYALECVFSVDPLVGPLCRTPSWDPFVGPVRRISSSDPFVGALCRTPLSDPFIGHVGQSPSSDPFVAPLCRTPLSDPFGRPLRWTPSSHLFA